jgi:hypothetical protein
LLSEDNKTFFVFFFLSQKKNRLINIKIRRRPNNNEPLHKWQRSIFIPFFVCFLDEKMFFNNELQFSVGKLKFKATFLNYLMFLGWCNWLVVQNCSIFCLLGEGVQHKVNLSITFHYKILMSALFLQATNFSTSLFFFGNQRLFIFGQL